MSVDISGLLSFLKTKYSNIEFIILHENDNNCIGILVYMKNLYNVYYIFLRRLYIYIAAERRLNLVTVESSLCTEIAIVQT